MIRINEAYRVLFLADHKIITKKSHKVKVYSIDESEYQLVKSIYLGANNSISDLQKVALLKKYEFLIDAQHAFNYYATPFEKASLFLEAFLDDGKDHVEVLRKKTVMIIGLGGVGACVAMHLLSSGVQNFILIDFDTIDSNNLNRQYCYSLKDVGLNKSFVLKKYLLDRCAKANIVAVNEKILSESQIHDIVNGKFSVDLVVNAADTPAYNIQNIVMKYCVNENTNYAVADVGINNGAWMICEASMLNSLQNLISENQALLSDLDCIKPCEGSLGPFNSIIVDYLCIDIIMFFLDQHEKVLAMNKTMIYDWNRNRLKKQKGSRHKKIC